MKSKGGQRPLVFLDTNVIRAILQGQKPAINLLSEQVLRKVRFAVNPIVLQELLHLAEAQEHPDLFNSLQSNWEILPIHEDKLD